MIKEVDRCRKALEIASSGKQVALVFGGDPGIYAMAVLVFDMANGAGYPCTIEIFPGGDSNFYWKFGFERCAVPICPFDKNNAHFLSIRNTPSHEYTVGYEREFKI